MFHLISSSPHFIDHVSFLFPSVHSPSHSFHVPQSISLVFTLFGCIHITWSFNLTVSFTFQPIPSLEINDLQVSLDKFLILHRYSLLEPELRWFYYSLSPHIKQEMQQYGVISGSKFSIFRPEITLYLDTFHTVIISRINTLDTFQINLLQVFIFMQRIKRSTSPSVFFSCFKISNHMNET